LEQCIALHAHTDKIIVQLKNAGLLFFNPKAGFNLVGSFHSRSFSSGTYIKYILPLSTVLTYKYLTTEI